MKRIQKALVGTAAATAMAISANPAAANDRYEDRGIGAGEVIAGALIIGGIAAVLSSRKDKHDRYHHGRDRRYGDYDRYGSRNGYRRTSSRKAVKRCIRRAERIASRYGGRARVTDIRDIDRNRYGYRVRGRIALDDGYRYGRGYDRGKFTCYFERGRVADVRYKGLKGLR